MPFEFKFPFLIVVGLVVVLLSLICAAIIISRFLPASQFRVTPEPWGLALSLVFSVLLAYQK